MHHCSAFSFLNRAFGSAHIPPVCPSAAIEEASEAEEDDAAFEATDFTLEGAMDMDALDAAAAELGEAASISIDLVGAALDAIPGVGEVLLAAEVRTCEPRSGQGCSR